jgi:hypothetical protein
MWKHLVRALAEHGRWLWQQRGRVRGVLDFRVPRRKREEADGRRSEERARFWAALREGQREAEARCQRRNP